MKHHLTLRWIQSVFHCMTVITINNFRHKHVVTHCWRCCRWHHEEITNLTSKQLVRVCKIIGNHLMCASNAIISSFPALDVSCYKDEQLIVLRIIDWTEIAATGGSIWKSFEPRVFTLLNTCCNCWINRCKVFWNFLSHQGSISGAKPFMYRHVT